MKLLSRNKQTIYYRNYVSSESVEVTDEYGNVLETGEYDKTYGEIHAIKAYVKSAIGTNTAEPFGDFTDKRRTIYVNKRVSDMNEYSQVWIGISPTPDEQGRPTVPHNFNVLGVARGLNHTRVAVVAVEVKLNA